MSAKKKAKLCGIQGQLTGISRQVKDSVADINNLILKWQAVNSTGLQQLTNLRAIKLALLSSGTQSVQKNFVVVVSSYSSNLEHAAAELFDTMEQLNDVVSRLNSVARKFKTLVELDNSISGKSDTLIFTQPVSWFEDNASQLTAMYAKELEVKQNIAENAAHVEHFISQKVSTDEVYRKCQDVLMFYSSCWLHQPFVNESRASLMLAEMLRATGHA